MNTEFTAIVGDSSHLVGKASIVRALYEGRDLQQLWDLLMSRASGNPNDAAAFHDLATILYALGRAEEASISHKAAISIAHDFRIRNGTGATLKVLAIVTAGDFMANTPIEFLLEQADSTIILQYVDADTKSFDDIPEHDVAFVAVAESAENRPVLENLERLLVGWKTPIVNNAPGRIIDLTRDKVAALLRYERSILAPTTLRVDREHLLNIASGITGIATLPDIDAFPVIIRPMGTHAGKGMERISTETELAGYLKSQSTDEFFVAPFIDYSDPDGKFRKQRIAFIDGRAFPSHLAVSDHWMVHYLSANMADQPERRAEEAAWMASFDADFAQRHAVAFDALYRHFGLDYFAIDCAELADGRLLLFEADVAMIVHSLDPVTVFPYKRVPMLRLFEAFKRALVRRIERSGPASVLPTCAHTGKPAVYQRTEDDCLTCSLAMLTGRSYEEIQTIATECDPSFPLGGPMSHSIMRGVANRCGIMLFSSIYMLWTKPAIIGMVSPTIPNAGHAVIWDGEKIIDPGKSNRVDRAYIDRCGLEFTQRAADLQPLFALDSDPSYTAGAIITGEPL